MLKRLVILISWTLFAYAAVNIGSVLIFATLVYAHIEISSAITNAWDKLNLLSLPILLTTCMVLEYKDRLPRIRIKKNHMSKIPTLLLSLNSIKKGLKSWLLYGLVPAIVIMIAGSVLIHDVWVIIPGIILYAISAFIYSFYYHMKIECIKVDNT